MADFFSVYDDIADFIKHVEGLELFPYVDTVGKLTIGYGRNLSDRGITKNEAEYLLMQDLEFVRDDLLSIFPHLDQYPKEIIIVLASMMFNLGKDRFLTFKKFINAIKKHDFESAKMEILNSKRAFQVPDRVKKEVFLINQYLRSKNAV